MDLEERVPQKNDRQIFGAREANQNLHLDSIHRFDNLRLKIHLSPKQISDSVLMYYPSALQAQERCAALPLAQMTQRMTRRISQTFHPFFYPPPAYQPLHGEAIRSGAFR